MNPFFPPCYTGYYYNNCSDVFFIVMRWTISAVPLFGMTHVGLFDLRHSICTAFVMRNVVPTWSIPKEDKSLIIRLTIMYLVPENLNFTKFHHVIDNLFCQKKKNFLSWIYTLNAKTAKIPTKKQK